MQDPGNVPEDIKILPDFSDYLPFAFTNSRNLNGSCVHHVGNSVSSGSNGLGGTGGQQNHSIAEVPADKYEFVMGDNGDVKILCKVCQYISNKKSNFKRHFTNMHYVHSEDSATAKQLECCGIRFCTKGEKFQHTKTIHKFGYKCVSCSKVFDRPALLQRHLAKHTGKKPYKCSLCSYQTPNKANAKRHIEKKHSDVHEGSILFVTDDGEQIQIEIVSKTIKSFDVGPCTSSPRAVIKSNADSSTFSFPGEISNSMPPSFKLPRCAPSTVTSSSFSPENSGSDTMLSPLFPVNVLKHKSDDKKRVITHSIQKIMEQEPNGIDMRRGTFLNKSATITSESETMQNGSSISLANPENGPVSTSYLSCSRPDINQLHSNWYYNYTSYLTRSSSLFPSVKNKNSDYLAAESEFSIFGKSIVSGNATGTAVSSNQDFSAHRVVHLRQCAHGCYYNVIDNQIASDFSAAFQSYPRASFLPQTPAYYNMLSGPDLRISSSISKQTENSSINSVNEEDDDDEIINVTDEDDEDTDTSKLQLLSTVCQGLGRFTTTDVKPYTVKEENNNKEEDGMGDIEIQCKLEGPPVVEPTPSSRSSSLSSNRDDAETDTEENETFYVPKKLRVSRRYCQ